MKHCLTFWKRTGKLVTISEIKVGNCFYYEDAKSVFRVVNYPHGVREPFAISYVCEYCEDPNQEENGAKYTKIWGLERNQIHLNVEIVEKHVEWLDT